MMHRIKSIRTKDDLIISATFFDGTVKEYSINKLFDTCPQLKALENKDLFNNIGIDPGGYGVSWNDDLDLDAETIWEDGIEVGKDNVDIMSELAARLIEARSKIGFTQKQLAEKTGIYQADISKIERGLSNPSISTLQRLAEGMGLQIEVNFK